MWLFKLIFAPFMALGGVLVVLAIFAPGFLSIMSGLSFLPGNPVLGWILFAWGIGNWLTMLFKGLGAMFGEK
ncbi:MAG: hypothetical protein ACLQVJ_01625 [Syntrophobacteraceae bacterium]